MFSLVDSSTRRDEGLSVEAWYAPIRRLDNHALAGIEVQLRGPAGGPLATAHALRATARALCEKRELDRLTWSVAQSIPGDGGTAPGGVPTLVTVDLESIAGLDSAAGAPPGPHIAIITRESLTGDPARTLRAVAAARRDGMVIAVDEIGSDPNSLSLLPLIEPDVIILAPALVAHPPDSAAARTAHAVAAQVELTGALVVADGVDSPEHRLRALALGAAYGLGALYPAAGSPEALGRGDLAPFPPVPRRPVEEPARSPYALVAASRTPVRSSKRLLVHMSSTLEIRAAAAGPETLVLGTFQRAEHFTEHARTRWRNMAERIAYAGVYGVGMGPIAEDGIHFAPLDPEDPLVEEWNVVVLGPHFCCALSGTDLHRGERDQDREFDYVVSYDRPTVVRCARSILDRFTT
ncbi:MAG: DICT sensory domain-containing protein [Rhodococcus sp. (in: high G+C Gram-positive bacteria)]|uniref:DICT sensory domain-containing protein n=1 Tax=Rhodococcus sp. TaxID=1831 RepID=UPI003BB1D0FD